MRQEPNSWLNKAQSLKKGADLILDDAQAKFDIINDAVASKDTSKVTELKEEDFPNFQPAHLLYGYAIENLLKGLAIAKDPSLINDKKFTQSLTSHDLEKLAKKLDILLTDDEKRILKVLSWGITWFNKYPSPLVAEDVLPKVDGKYDVCGILFNSDHPKIDSFYDKIENLLKKSI